MNDHQRKMARKSGAACGYEGGGVVGAVSGAIERVGRALGTDKAKKIKAADDMLREPREAETPRRQDIFGRGKRLEEQEREALEGKAGGGFIQQAIKRPGQLHRDLGVPQGQNIPPGRIAAAAQGSGKVAQRARFAQTLAKIRNG